MAFIVFVAALIGCLTAIAALFLVFPRETLKSFFWLKLRLNRLLPSWFPADHRPWFWKGVGGSIGFLIGGHLGLVAGVVFGHSLARPTKEGSLGEQLERELVNPGASESPKLELDEAQAVFFLSVFTLLAKLLVADGKLNQIEAADIDSIRRLMDEVLALDPERRELAANIFRAARDSTPTFIDYAQQFYHLFRFAPEVLEQMLDILLWVSHGEPLLQSQEESLLQATAIIFDLDQDRVARLKAFHAQGYKDPYGLLGVAADDSISNIAEKYRRLTLTYNPEFVISQGVASEFLKLADRRFREIQLAFDQIVREQEGD